MKRTAKIFGILLIMVGMFTIPGHAQETELGYNPNSVDPIAEYEQLYRKRVWRRMDLSEKQNKGFFAYNNEITKIIIEAVKAGVLTPYTNDSLTTRMTKEEFLEQMKQPDFGGGLSEEEKEIFGDTGGGDDWGDSGWGDTGDSGWGDTGDSGWGDSSSDSGDTGDSGDAGTTTASSSEPLMFRGADVSVIEIMEDIIFDKRRARQYYDIQSFTLIIPPELFPETGLQRNVASFKYKDLFNLFKSMPDEAIWFNRQNQAQHKNLADAFLLRLFNARIVKVQNPDDSYIVDIYGGDMRRGLVGSEIESQKLMELEHNLWEY